MDYLKWNGHQAEVKSVTNTNFKKYILKSDANLRDQTPEGGMREIAEGETYCHSASPLFDALFALSWQEAIENQVDRISDWSFEAEGIEAIETGKKWNYIWTRDTAYSSYLSLGITHPRRLKNALEFKLSAPRQTAKQKQTEELQIVQDTGSGGSWPISTDRVSWVLGAQGLFPFLEDADYQSFKKKADHALFNTVMIDRQVVFDEQYGLYRGEESFLDWREQTYPLWTKNDTLPLAESFSLSTNICHHQALVYLSKYATQSADRKRFSDWANQLQKAINTHFWIESSGLYSALFMPKLVREPLKHFELLGNSFAVIFEIADAERSKKIVENYPHSPSGAPVIHPQLPDVPIYHNRAIWPFVTAFALQASIKCQNAQVSAAHMMSLVRGTALNLSNMENFEFWNLDADYHHQSTPELDGPVVNSQRQLWSVAAYLDMVIKSFFGLSINRDSVLINPIIPVQFLEQFFSVQSTIALHNLIWRKKAVTLIMTLPKKYEGQWLAIDGQSLSLNGKKTNGQTINFSELQDFNTIEWTLVDSPQQEGKITHYQNQASSFAPPTPLWQSARMNEDGLRLTFNKSEQHPYRLYKNGLEAGTLEGNQDIKISGLAMGDQVVLVERGERYDSLPSKPIIFALKSTLLPIFASENISKNNGALSKNAKMLKLSDSITVPQAGRYKLELAYTNLGPVNTGITAGLRTLRVFQESKLLTEKTLVMPHHEEQEIRRSSSMEVMLEAKSEYTLTLEVHPNMSSLAHFEKYTKRGGKSGEDFSVELHGVYLTLLPK